MAEAWAAIERNRNRITLIFTEGEPLLREMEEEGQMPPETVFPGAMRSRRKWRTHIPPTMGAKVGS